MWQIVNIKRERLRSTRVTCALADWPYAATIVVLPDRKYLLNELLGWGICLAITYGPTLPRFFEISKAIALEMGLLSSSSRFLCKMTDKTSAVDPEERKA